MKITFDRFGNADQANRSIHFTHANGFPPGVYQQLFDHLEGYQITAPHLRPLWGYPDNDPKFGISSAPNWRTYAHDLNAFHQQEGTGQTIGMGHSLGAVTTLLDAVKNPERYKGLILIEPVMLPDWIYRTMKLLPLSMLKYIVPPARIARVRNTSWTSKQSAYDHFRPKKVFSRVSDEGLWNYVNASLRETGQGATLSYSREWEVHVYITQRSPWRAFQQSETPVLVIRGGKTEVINDDSWARIKKLQPGAHQFNIENAGHLVPLEHPQVIATAIHEFCEKLA